MIFVFISLIMSLVMASDAIMVIIASMLPQAVIMFVAQQWLFAARAALLPSMVEPRVGGTHVPLNLRAHTVTQQPKNKQQTSARGHD